MAFSKWLKKKLLRIMSQSKIQKGKFGFFKEIHSDIKSMRLFAMKSLKQDTWLVSQFRDEIHVGDIGLIWKARKASGIYAVGEIISNPQIMTELPESSKYWIDKSDRGKQVLRVVIRYKLKLRLTNALFSDDLKKIPELHSLHIFKQSQGTNFKVESSQWQIISRLLKQKYNFEYI